MEDNRVSQPPPAEIDSQGENPVPAAPPEKPVRTITIEKQLEDIGRVLAPPGIAEKSGAQIFRWLIGFVPVGAGLAIVWICIAYPLLLQNEKSTVPVVTTVTELRSTNPAAPSSIITSTYPISNTGTLGIFDPALGSNSKPNLFLFGLLIFLVASIVETSLIMIYGTLYVNREENKDSPLGLPQGATRIFLLIIVILVLITFSLLPGSWGDNKTVGIMFGILSTIVGFYFGSGAVSDGIRQGKQAQPSVTDTQTTNTAGRSETRTVEVKPSSDAPASVLTPPSTSTVVVAPPSAPPTIPKQ